MITVKELKSGKVFFSDKTPLVLNVGTSYKIYGTEITFKEVFDQELVKKILRIAFKHSTGLLNLQEVYNEILLITYEYRYKLCMGGYTYESGLLFDENLGDL